MAITVEGGTGLTDADSYVSVTDADASLGTNIHETTWGAQDTAGKENLLKWATRLLDERVDWCGVKSVDGSALRWPRTGVYDRDGVLIASNAMPSAIQIATAEVARHLALEDHTLEDDTLDLDRMRVDVLEFYFRDGRRFSALPRRVIDILTGYGTVIALQSSHSVTITR